MTAFYKFIACWYVFGTLLFIGLTVQHFNIYHSEPIEAEYVGRIHCTRFYKEILTTEEINKIMNEGLEGCYDKENQ